MIKLLWAYSSTQTSADGLNKQRQVSRMTDENCLRNVTSEDQARVSGGRLFYARPAGTGKARSPRVARRVDGTCSVVVSPERRQRRATISDVGDIRDRHVGRRLSDAGAVPCTQWYARTHNRNLIRSGTRSEAPVAVKLCVLTSGATERRHSARTAVGSAGIQRYQQGPSYTNPTW